MQTNTTLTLDNNARLEFGFRIRSTKASYRELEALLGADAKVDWARTKAHPNRAKYFAIPAEIAADGRIHVPSKVVDAFTKYGGFLMVKLVTPLPAGSYANLAMYHKLWEFDKTAPQRENGEWVYSMPIHGLDKAGEGRRFFFALRIDGDKSRATLTVDRFEVTRGKEHFTLVKTTSYGPFPETSVASIPRIAQNWETEENDNRHKPLKDLPIEEAIEEFLNGFDEPSA